MSPQSREFDALGETYYRAWLRYHPEAAVEAGIGGYAALLAPYDDDDMGALVALDEKLLAALEELGPEGLDADRLLDYRLLMGSALLEHRELNECDWRRHHPGRFVPLQALCQLATRPVEHALAAVEARLAALPAYLRGARVYVGDTPELIAPLWLEQATADARGAATLVRGLHEAPRIAVLLGYPTRLSALQHEAAASLEDFADYLERDIAPLAAGDCRCGRERYECLLRLHHFLDLSTEEVELFGTRVLEDSLRELRAVTEELRGDQNAAALATAIEAAHPDQAGLVEAYREQMSAARCFVVGHGLASVVESECLHVEQTPRYLQSLVPTHAYLPPPLAEPGEPGGYFVTPGDVESQAREHNHARIALAGARDGWPGRHSQAATRRHSKTARSLVRILNPSATLGSGWASYCEQLMWDKEYLALPQHRFMLLRERLEQALLLLVDVRFHAGSLALNEALDWVEQMSGMSHSRARKWLGYHSQMPTVPAAQLLGGFLIGAARDILVQRGSAPSLRSFHDRLLAHGPVALPLVLEREYAPAVWREARRRAVAGTRQEA